MKVYKSSCDGYSKLLVEDILLVVRHLNSFPMEFQALPSELYQKVSDTIYNWSLQNCLYLQGISNLRMLEGLDMNMFTSMIQSCIDDFESFRERLVRKREREEEIDSLGQQVNPSVHELVPLVLVDIFEFIEFKKMG